MSPITWNSTTALAGLSVAVLAAVTMAGLVFAGNITSRGDRRRGLLAVALAAVAFQVVHFVEHIAQGIYWLMHPTERPWLTPWADVASDGLGYWCAIVPGQGANAMRGVEILHLSGNAIFFAGVIAMSMLAKRANMSASDARPVRRTMAVQAFHVVEHSVLVGSLFITGRPLGVSTGFGMLDPASAWSSSYRVLFHFGINLIATIFALQAIKALREAGMADTTIRLPGRRSAPMSPAA